MSLSNSTKEQLNVIWEALHGFREDCIPDGQECYDEQWNEICSAMAFIEEDLTEYSKED